MGVYLDWLYSSDADAGWHGNNILGTWHDFRGDLPQSSGYIPTDKMMREIEYLKTPHHDLAAARNCLASMPQSLAVAVCHDVWYRRKVDASGRPYDQFTLAHKAGVSPKTFRDNVYKGLRQIAEHFGYREAA